MLLAAVAAAHTAYYIAPEGSADRGWIAYVCTHLLLIVALALLLPWASQAGTRWAAAAGAVACWWGILESAQAVGCSLLQWGTLSAADLCEQAFGSEVYAIAAALGVSWLLVGAWRRQKEGGHG